MLGIGAIIGTGIFVLTGRAAAANAGPAVALSFVVAGIASAFAGLCYAEMASMIPIAGSAYTYSYATMGELVAWIIGWDLILEYLVGAATVSVGWSGYVVAFLHDAFGVDLPAAWVNAPVIWKDDRFQTTGAILNVPAILVVLAVTALLVRGIKESARFNTVVVFTKVVVVLLFIAFAARFIHPRRTGTHSSRPTRGRSAGSASRGSSRGRRWSSSLTSVSTPSRRRRRRLATRGKTC